MEKSPSAVGVDGHAVHATGHMGVLLLEHVRRTCIQVHRGVQARTGTERIWLPAALKYVYVACRMEFDLWGCESAEFKSQTRCLGLDVFARYYS